ncbi:amidohydrolase family protein [Bradyrhizobium sp. CCBAU 11361]|uniref:amidohydrolase family protein n=1 Tax=Bradyrhizobium sp. CCBAU 11361 TaxID=1630812 RepID=UPI00230529FA|nr:amidohydrolase family protein [Bradyrhizobium sp. CCBAU 11361]MDA9491884.1 amidohydrolase [Bradyrhizobium sp. CCBAU 11361]
MTNRIPKIAFEEHFMAPGFEHYSKVFTQHIDDVSSSNLFARLADFDDLRLAAMDEAGIEIMVLSQTGPAIQAELDTPVAIKRARENNDFLAKQIQRRPTRFAGFASLPMHSPREAAAELERAILELGFKGALVHGHTSGRYYDDAAYDVLWERLEALDAPLYLHPTDFPELPKSFQGHPELTAAAWGWGVETGTHALRLLFGGVFDRYPSVKIVLGHMGEGLPFLRWRFDSRFAVYSHGINLKRRPSEYIGSNILITTTGVCSPGALLGAIEEVGADSVMFSVDYPYESATVAADFIEQAPLNDEIREKICYRNAARLLKLKPA